MKLSRTLPSLLLAAGALGLGIYVYRDASSVTESERKARERNVFVPWRRDDISRLELAYPDARLTLVRDKSDAGDSTWRMVSPRQEPADPHAVDRLLNMFEFATVIRKVGDDAPGFAPPRLEGAIAMGSLTHRFALGGTAPVPEGAAYLRLVGDATVVVSKDLSQELLRGPDAFRERNMVPYLSVQLARIEIKRAQGALTLERIDDTSFRIDRTHLRASRTAMDRIWTAFADMRAESFVPESVARERIGVGGVAIRLIPKEQGQTAGEMRVGGACDGMPGVLVWREAPMPAAACVPSSVMQGLEIAETELVDRHLFVAHADEVTELRLEDVRTHTVIDLARKGSGFRQRLPDMRDLPEEEAEIASQIVLALTRAEGVHTGALPTAAEPLARASVRRGDAPEERVELLALLPEPRVRRVQDGAVLTVPSTVARRLVPSKVTLRPRDIWTPPPSRIESAETSCSGTSQRLDRASGTWQLLSPKGHIADRSAIVDATDALSRARARAWIAPDDDGSFGLSGGCIVRFGEATDAGMQERVLVFGRQDDDDKDAVFAQVRGEAGVFLLPITIRDAWSQAFVSRDGFSMDGVIDRIVVSGSHKRVVLDKPDAGALVDTLSAMRPERAIFGPPRPEHGLSPGTEVNVVWSKEGKSHALSFWLGAKSADGVFRYARILGEDAVFLFRENRLGPLVLAVP